MPDSAMPSSSSKASLSCISSGCLWSYSFPSRTANRHWKTCYSYTAEKEESDLYLMYADILLLSLNHPNPLFPHLEDNSKYIHHVVFPDALKDPVNGNHGPWSANSRAAVDHDWSLLRTDSLSECSHKPDESNYNLNSALYEDNQLIIGTLTQHNWTVCSA